MENTINMATGSILVVDDDPENLKLVGGLLSSWGCTVRLLSQGWLAVRSAQANPPDLVLLDIRLPDMDGYAVCAALKADACTREVPVIFCSALGATFDKVRAFAAGAVDYVSKPFDTEEVLARVATHLALRRMQRQLQQQNDQLQQEIAERKRAEQALRESEERFRAVWECAGNAMALSDMHGVVITANPAYHALFGYTPNEVIGQDFAIVFPPEERDSARSLYRELFTAALPIASMAALARRKDGTQRMVESRIDFVRHEEKRLGMLSVIRDITERQRMEDALRASEERFRLTFDLSPIGAAMETLDGRYLRVNDMLCQITDYTREELRGRHFADITHPEDREKDLRNTQLLVTGMLDEYVTEKRYIRKDGQIAWVQLSVRLMNEGPDQPAYILATMVNITARKQLENALHTSRALFRSILDNAPLQIAARDLQGHFTLVNKSFWEWAGLSRPQDALEKRIEDFFAPSKCEWIYATDREVLATGQPLTSEIIVPSNGRPSTWLSTKFPIHDSAGAVTAIGVIAQDITERKEIEQALEQANVVLFQRIAELSALNHIAEALTQWTELPAALRAVGATLAGLFDQANFAVWLRDETGAMLSRLAIVADDQTTMGGPTVALADDPVAAYVLSGGLPKVLAPASRLPLVARPPDLPADGRAGGCMVLPLLSGGGAIGLLCVRAAPPERMYTPADVALAQTIASTLASAIENARLFAAEQRQRRAAESLREVTTVLTGSLDLETVVRTIFEQLGRVVRYDGAAIFLADGDALVLWKAAGIGETHIGHRIPLSETDPTVDVFLNRRPRIIDDTRTCADWIDWDGWDISLSYMGAPLVIGGTTIGALTTDHVATHIYGAEDLRMLEAFAHQAAIAIENARLFARAQAAAAEEERKRLARELHDSVSQALYLANLNADVLPQIWELDPSKGRRALGDLQQFTRSALAEMRMLLIELRPDALVGTPLHELLRTLGIAMSAKHSLVVDAQLAAVPILPEEVQIALYRIAQETLNNIVKHAQARHVTLLLQITPSPAASECGKQWCGQVILRIVDDGRGFEVERAAKGHLGLRGMRERAGAVGASLQINSVPGAGAHVVVIWRGSTAAAKEQL